jgi:hypothetical protein
VKLEKRRILVAADNREGLAVGTSSNLSDSQCKIRSFDGTVVAFSGVVSYWDSSSKLGWNAFSDAQEAYQSHGESAPGFARTWIKLLDGHVGAFARSDPNFIHDLGLSPGDIVCGGYFLRWVFGSPVVLLEWVIPEANLIRVNEYGKLPEMGTEESTNKTTQELIEGQTPRAKAVALKWKSLSQRYPKSEVSWRHLEFLIRETSKLDPTVSPTSDVVEITSSNKLIWRSKIVCR